MLILFEDMCSPGTFSTTSFEPCTECPVGMYQGNWGSTECDPCPIHTTTIAGLAGTVLTGCKGTNVYIKHPKC